MSRTVGLLLIVLTCLVHSVSFGQFRTNASRSELGPMLGGSYYIGDLNRFNHFKGTQPALGLVYRYNIHSRLAFRANAMYGRVIGDDRWAKDAAIRNRNLNFRSDIFEVGAGFEFNYLPFQLGGGKYWGTAYLMAEIGVFRMNPKTEYNGEWVELRPLGTEGQGSSLSSKAPYSMYQLCVPLGIGLKVGLGSWLTFSVEYGIRKTFTDYLDDVGSNSYVNPTDLADANGPMAASLANRSLDGNQYGMRGNNATKDWYSFFGAMLTVRLGKHKKCAFTY